MSCKYCEEDLTKEPKMISMDGYFYSYIDCGYLKECTEYGAETETKINFCPMCGRCLKPNLTPAQENAYKGSPLRSSHKSIDGVVGDTKNSVHPVFHIGDTIRFKSTGRIEKIGEITDGGRFINSVSVEDVELVKEK